MNYPKHFPKNEWVKDPSKVSQILMNCLEQIRIKTDTIMIIHVAWDDGGHATNSYHYKGMAVDFHFKGDITKLEQLEAIIAIPELNGIGFYPEWEHPGWHVDIRRANRLFWVQKKGIYHYTYEKNAMINMM